MVDVPAKPEHGDEIENHQAWEWDSARRCWVYYAPHRIYPSADGGFSVSTCEAWHDGHFETFEQAEAEALGLDEASGD